MYLYESVEHDVCVRVCHICAIPGIKVSDTVSVFDRGKRAERNLPTAKFLIARFQIKLSNNDKNHSQALIKFEVIQR